MTGPAADGPLSVELTDEGPRLSHAPPARPDTRDAVLVEPTLVGICRSDLKEVGGRRPGPSQFGHELVGLVTESSTPRLPVGSRVCLDPNVPLRRGTGFARSMWIGGDASRLVRALPLAPAGVSARRLVFAEPMACASHCLTMARAHLGGASLRGMSLCVIGAGMAGVLIARLAASAGARVRVLNRDGGRLEFLAARRALPGIDGSPLSEAGPGSYDIVIVATSFVLPELLSRALGLVRPRGLVMLYGGTASGDRLDGLGCDLDTVRRSELVRTADWQGRPVMIGGSYGTTAADFHKALRALGTPDGLGVERLITSEVSLAELPATLRRMASTPEFGKILTRPLL